MTTETPLELSVCTVARAADAPVERLLTALDAQSAALGSYEVVVVDSTPTGELAGLVRDRRVPVRVVRQPADAPHAVALNSGWRSAQAAAVGFLSVDLVPARGWVESMTIALRRGRRLVTGGLQPNPDTLDRSGALSHRLWASPRTLQLVSSANMGCLRADLEAVGGFDPAVPAGVADIDLAARLVDAGVDPLAARHVVAYEDVDGTDLAAIAATRQTTGVDDALAKLAEHPRARARLLVGGVFWHRRNAEALLALVGAAAAVRDRRALLLAAPWLHERTCLTPATGGPRRKWLILPGVFAFDVYDGIATTVSRLRRPKRM